MEAIKLNLVPSDLTKPICHASQFDDGREIMLMLYDGQMPYVLSDEEIELDVKKLDGNIVTTDLTVESGTNYVIMVTTEQMCAIAGRNNCELKVQKDGKTIHSKNFYLAVEESATAGGIESASQINNLETQIEGLVANQYDSDSVIFDSEPTEGHGTGYTVTSEGIKQAIEAAGGGGASIDDTTTANNKTWSSNKINTELGKKPEINDASTANNKVWSSEKTSSEVDGIKAGGLNDNSIAIEKTDFLEVKIDNLHNTATDVTGSWFTTSGGKVILQSNQYTTTYTAVTILIPNGVTKITFSSSYLYAYVRDIYFSNDLELPASYIELVSPKAYARSGLTVNVPVGSAVAYIAFQNIENQDVMINAGDTALPFEPYSVKYLLDGKELAFAEDSSDLFECPDDLYSVVGDTLELFYKGITKVVDSDLLEFDVNASEGKAFKRKYVVTPTTAGTIPLTLVARDNFGNQLKAKEINLIKTATPTSPNTLKNVLCIGDSLTLLGTWCAELDRRLTGSGGSPSGLGLTNIDFVGTMQNGSTGYEGRGGWSFKSYSTSMASDEFMLINGTFDKTSADQHSIYKDSNNKQWKLETITSNQIKIIRVSASGTLPSSGTLTWVSGGVNTGNIVYTSSEQAAGNPFWNDNLNDIDFVTYASNLGISSIDYAVILLGWNSTGVEQAIYKSQAETFIAKLHRDYPNCRVILLGLQTPSRDGLAVNYGTDWKYFATMQKAWIINNIYKSIAEDTANVYYVNLASQFDAEYGYPTTNMNVNVRSSEIESIQSNGIHPNTTGQYQIADAVYRRICALLST